MFHFRHLGFSHFHFSSPLPFPPASEEEGLGELFLPSLSSKLNFVGGRAAAEAEEAIRLVPWCDRGVMSGSS